MTFREVFSGWERSENFREAYHQFLLKQGGEAIFWEHPKVAASTRDTPYECVLVPSSNLARLRPNPNPFREQMFGVKYTTVFDNLGGDARMIVPTGNDGEKGYAHLMDFVRTASSAELHHFWKTVAEELNQLILYRPVYLNTHGLGVSWLHVRLDSRPKYYSFRAYR